MFFNFAVERILGELTKGLMLVEVGAPNDYRAAFVGRLESNVFAFS